MTDRYKACSAAGKWQRQVEKCAKPAAGRKLLRLFGRNCGLPRRRGRLKYWVRKLLTTTAIANSCSRFTSSRRESILRKRNQTSQTRTEKTGKWMILSSLD